MIDQKQKQQIVKNMAAKIKKAKAVIFTDFTGLSVAELEDLRSQLREKHLEYQVVKKKLLKRAYPELIDYSGSVAVALGDDEVSLSKILYNFEKIKILVGRNLDLEAIQELAKLPTREELLNKFICLLKNSTNKLILCLKNIKV